MRPHETRDFLTAILNFLPALSPKRRPGKRCLHKRGHKRQRIRRAVSEKCPEQMPGPGFRNASSHIALLFGTLFPAIHDASVHN